MAKTIPDLKRPGLLGALIAYAFHFPETKEYYDYRKRSYSAIVLSDVPV